MATKPRAKMVQREATLDEILKSGVRYQQFAEDHPAEAAPPEPSGMARRVLGDGGIALLKGAIGVPEAAVGLADLATGGAAGKFLENEGGAIGFRPKMAKQFLDTYKSPEQQAADKAVQEAQGFVDTTVAALKNPSVVLGSVAESAPMMLGGGVIARSLLRMAPAGVAGSAAAPVVAGAAGEGIVAAGSQAESIRQETPDGLLTGEQSSLAAASGLATGFLGYLGGKVAQRLGITDIDTVLAGKAGPEVTKGFTRRVLEGAVAEGLLEELPQSVQEQVAQNMALGRPLGEGVPQAAVLGALAGGLMGGGGNAISYGGQVRREKVEGNGPASKAINAGLEDTAKQADAIEAAAVPPVVDPLAAAGAAPTEPVSMGVPVDPLAAQLPGPGLAPAGAVPGVTLEPAALPPEQPVAAPPAPRPITEGRKINLDGKEWIVTTRPQGGYSITNGSETRTVPAAAKTGKRIAELLAGGPAAPAVAPAAPVPAAAPAAVSDSQAFADAEIPLPDEAAPPAPMDATLAAPLDANANQAATSPTNDRPEPTEAQKKAGNYALGHHKLAGLDLSIENPAGSTRRGTDRDGKAWENQLQHHYGYIKGTIGNDKDHVDAFVKPGTPDEWNGTVFVVDQVHPDTGKFDEHKVLLGFDSIEEAKEAYRANYAKDWQGLKAISAMPAAEFKTWVKDGPKNKPLAPSAPVQGYESRLADRRRRMGAATTQEEADAIVAEEHADGERHFEGTSSLERGRSDVKRKAEAAARERDVQDRLDRGEWVVVDGSGQSLSGAQQDAARMNRQNDGYEYETGIGQHDDWTVRRRKKPAPAAEPVAEPIVEHVTGKGKTLRGVIRRMPEADAKAMDPGTFKKNGGWFIRASRAGLSPERLQEIADTPLSTEGTDEATRPQAQAAGAEANPPAAAPTTASAATGTGPAGVEADGVKDGWVEGNDSPNPNFKTWTKKLDDGRELQVLQTGPRSFVATNATGRPGSGAFGTLEEAKAAAKPSTRTEAPAPAAAPAVNLETWWDKSLTAAGRRKAQLAAGLAKGETPTYPDAIRWQYLPLTAQARLRELQASGWDADKVGEPSKAAPQRWEGLVVRQSPREGEMFVSEPANDRDGGFQNLATFKVRADGKAGKINQYHTSTETTGMVEKAVARWNEQQAPAATTATTAPEGAREKRARLIAEREVTSETARKADVPLSGGAVARVVEHAERGRFSVTIGAESYGSFSMDDAGKVSGAKARANWAMNQVLEAANAFAADFRGDRKLDERSAAPMPAPAPAGPAVSDQLRSYANAIRAGKGTAGMLDQIRMDERLLDGEAESLLKLAAEYKVPGAKAAPAPKPAEMAGFDVANDAEMALRRLAHADKRPGDVELGNGKFVTLEQAMAAARANMTPEQWKMPFQFNRALDIASVDWNRMVKAMTGEAYRDPTRGGRPQEPDEPAAAPAAPVTVEPTTLAELVEALDAGKRVHYDYAGTDGRTLWVEETPRGWVLKDRGDGENTTFTKGGANASGGWSKDQALRTAREVAEFRFTKWKPVAAQAPSPVAAPTMLEDAQRRYDVADDQEKAIIRPALETLKAEAAAKDSVDPDAEKKAKALSDLNDALGDLAGIFGKNFKANMLPEQEQKLMPVLTRVMDAAFRAGYYSFKQAARFVLDTIRDRISPEVADSITLDHLQGAYIGMAGKYKDQGATSKRDVVAIESLDELAPEPAAASAIEQPAADDDVTMSGDVLMRADESALDMLTVDEAAPMSQEAMDDVANFVDGERMRDVAMFGQQPVRKSFPRLKGEGKGGQLKLPAGVEVLTPEQAKARLDEWKAEAARQGADSKLANYRYGVLSLFDTTGMMAQPWIDAGYNVFTYDLQDGQDINEFDAQNLLEQHGNDNIMVVIAQPPCTDFASSGARWWAEKDADGRTEASNELVRQVLRTVELFRPAVWAMENPVGRIASQNKLPEPTAAFDPWHFGDDYTKRTQFFGRFNPDMPTAPVFPARGSLIHKMSSSAQKERSDTPEGIAYAFFMANNFAGMGPAGRLAAEFAGVDRALFERAVAAGKSESAIKDAIEDPYYENDLSTVRDELTRMAGPTGGPGSTQLPTPAAAPAQSPAPQPPAASTGAQNADDAIPALDQPSPPALAGVPADPVQGADGQRPAGDSAAPGGGVDGGGNVEADRPGRAGGRGLRGGAGNAPVPATGAGSGGGTGADGGVSNPGPADAGTEGSSQRRVAPPEFARKDFRITDETRLGEGGAKTKYRQNVAAIRLINELEASGRPATVDEQNVLARYVGWGMLSQAFDPDHKDWTKEYAELKELLTPDEWAAAFESTQYAHYTSEQIVVDGIYAAVRRMGFNGGKTLELGGGVGNFIGLMPDDLKTGTRFTLIERERISARIAKHLYPEQNVQLADATEFRGNDDYYDGAFGNPPFASTPLTDVSGRKHLSGLSVHNYFFAKSVDMLRPGGILAQVVSNSFMDAGRDRARKYIGERTRLLGAIRLPNNAFAKNAGTEVTTDLIFLQKLPEAEWGTKATREASAAWADLVEIPDPAGGKPIPVNRYFAEHPEMMLGEMGRKGTMYRADMPALVARPGQDTAALLREAVARLPADVYVPPAAAGTASMTANLRQRMADPGVEVGGYFERDGKMFERLEDEAGEAMVREITPATQWTEKTTLGDIRFDRIKQLAGMRVTLRALIAAEMAGENRMQPGVLRQKLNEQYDAYVKDHGLINDKPTIQAFGEDPDYPLLASLENDFKPGMGAAAAKSNGVKPFKATAKKAPIFTRSVVAARRQVVTATTPADALAVSMAERGRIDAAYMSQLLGKDAESILTELASGDRPLLFKDPAANEYVLRDAYLSGNVRKKLDQAKAANMFNNVRALEDVQPADVGVHEIHVRIGSPWVPTKVYEDFAKAILGDGTQARVSYLPLTSGFMASIRPGNEVAQTNTYGTPKMGASEILEALLNNRAIKITYTSEGKTYTDKEGTEAANLKAAEMRDKFQDWVFSDPDRAEVLARAYNDENNNYVTRQYDGTMMTFPGKVPDEIIKFRKHQRNAIARIVQDRTALLDHVVGAGKTFTVIAGAMELKRTGLAKKSLIAVPNHLVKQWAADFYRLYPGANILAATKKDFQGPNRRRFLARIATGDWDAVILAHSSFGFIAPAPEFEQAFNERQVADIMATIEAVKGDGDEKDPKNKRRIKQLAKMKEGLEQRIKSLRDRPMDSLLDFGQLGVDQLFVDEAHLFKNLMFSTKMQGVSGLGDGTGSQRAYDMYVKTQQVMEANGRGQGVVFATGTPISNSLAEMYHMQRYLMPAAMVEGGFQSFDAWANTYASVDQVWMQKISGDGFKVQNRMSTFVNTPELLKMFDQVSDTVTMDDIKKAYAEENDGAEFPLPKLKTGRRQPVSLAKSPGQEAFMQEIAARAQKLEQRKGPPQKGDDNHLTVMGDARKAAMDIRLVKPEVVEREAGGRIDRATDEVVARYKQYDAQKGTQLVFSDLGTPLKHAKAELAEYAALKARADRLEDEALVAASQLGDKAAADALEDAQEAADQIEAKGADWLDAAKAAERGFSVYDDFRAALIEKGIPAEEIAFIHDFNTDDQKAALFRKVNAGQIRVLMGSTPKLGAGTNVQDRLVALHHLDVPWKPSDVEQREGRIIRQGNLLATVPTADRPNPFYIPGFEVEVLAYVTRDTLDMRMWQIQEAKLKMINQLRERKVGREVDNAFQDMEMSAGEMQAAATGNMDLLREIQLRNDVKLLEQKKRAFDAQRSDLTSRRKEAERKLASLPKQIAELEPWAAAYEAYAQQLQEDRPVDVTVNGKRYTSRSEAQTVLRELTSAHEQRLEERRAIIKANNGAELTDDDRAKTTAEIARQRALGTADGAMEADRLTKLLDTVKPVPKMPKLAVEFNGETYGSTAAVAEAFTEATGDSSRIDWTFEGKTYIRRTAIAKALQPVVAKAVQTDTERAVGGFGPYSVTVEGNTDKYGKALDVQVMLDGKIRSRQARLGGNKDSDADPSKTASDVVESVAMGLVSGARSELEYARYNLQRAEKAMADLNATAAPDSAWPGEAELERARAAHREVLQRLANGGTKPQADDGMGGSTNLTQTGSPAANETDVLFADLSRVGAQIARQGYERADVKRMQAARRLQGILADKAAGKLTPEEFDAAVAALADQMADVSATKQANRLMAERQRGADILREKLIRARRTGDLDPDAVGLGLWLLDKNPDIASDLSVSILSPKDDSPAGDYNPVTRVIRLFKDTGNPDTIAHEILHHAERMMPPELQAPIRAEWAKQVETSLKAAQNQPAVLAALQDMMVAAAGNRDAYQRTVQAFRDGVLDYGQHYQLFNASEFWAVNGARILANRYLSQDSVWLKIQDWLRDLVQYIRGALGLRSDAPVLRALANVTDPANFGPERGGDFASQDMLSQGDDVRQAPAFHGTPYRRIDKFSTDAIGTGEGQQAYGWGLYFASKREVAEHYRSTLAGADFDYADDSTRQRMRELTNFDDWLWKHLSDTAESAGYDTAKMATALRAYSDRYSGSRAQVREIAGLIESGKLVPKRGGQVYEVDVPEDSELLLWDKPLAEQSAQVRQALGALGFKSEGNRGSFFYQRLADLEDGQKEASQALLAAGVRGIKYLDGMSRDGKAGTFNYVIFDGNDVAITGQTYASLGFKQAFSQAGAGMRDVHLPGNYRVGDFFNTDGRISWWHKTVGTMHNLAARSPLFKRTYDAVQNFVNDVSFYATEAANEAPRILPKLDQWRDVFKSPLSPEQAKAIAAPIFEGTLTWARDISGKPVKVADLEAAAAKLDVHQKAQELLRRDMVDARVLRMWQGLPMDQYESIIETKYAKEALKPGLVWRDSELKSMFGLTEGEDGTISLYREARRAIDKSLNNLAIADMLRLGGDDVASMRERALASGDPMKAAVMLRDRLYELAAEQPDRANVLNDTGNRMIDKADQVGDLKKRGYAPLSRFGQYTLDVVDATGERVYFGLFESAAERARMARQMRENFPGASIESGTVSQEEYRLFAGVSPETLELFGEFLGLEADGGDAASKAFQTYIKLTKSTRSAMKRLIERKGIDGFSEDVGRVLAGFVYSNARQTSSNLHQGEIAESVAAFPKGPGQMKDAAVQLMEYVKNPQEEAQAIRGMLFAQYLGGSVASALVNMTQPATVTLPYLSQFGGAAKAAKRVAGAARIVNKESTGDAALDKALKVAEETGVVSPQEVHQLQAQAMGRATLRTGDGTRTGDLYAKGMNKLAILGFAWGKLFGMAEQVNRRITFIAAYRTAVDEGMPNPAKFATQAVTETQFTYNKGNKPRWARGAVGSVLFTFKQYSISYLELMNRMWNAGDEGSPERAAGRKAVLLAMAVLFLSAGADGLPFVEDAEDVLDAFMQRLGYNFSSKQARHEFLADVLGDGGARFVANGLSGLPGAPLDVSGRLGMGNMIPGTGLLPKKADHTRDATEIIGPMGDFVKRGFQAAGQLVDGEPVKAIQTISPVAARNAAKAVDMANTGMYRDDRGRKVIDTDGYDALIKAIGFQPNDVARVQESTGMVQNLIAQNKLRETEIAEKWAIGIFEGDQDKQDEARAELARWNRSNPSAQIRIEMPQVLKRVRAMRQSKAERLEKTAPREIRGQVKAELAGAGQ